MSQKNYLEAVIDSAFKRANKISTKRYKSKLKTVKLFSMARMQSFADYILNKLRELKQELPIYEKLHPFYQKMIDLYFGSPEKYKFYIGCITWSERMIERLKREYLEKVRYSLDLRLVYQYRKQFYGRVVSVLEQNEDKYNKLVEFLREIRKLPQIDPSYPVLVVAGFPNVGKSTFISQVSTAKVQVASYPFTTKTVHVGHYFIDDFRRVQLVDTPGIMRSDLRRLNSIEMKAYMAIRYLADVLIFIVDASESSGYSIQDQLRLLRLLLEDFKGPVYLIKSKVDIANKSLDQLPPQVKKLYEANLLDKQQAQNIFLDILRRENLKD
jgi:nucleolar GTP-binding protein